MVEKIDWDRQPLGQMPDKELAQRLGTHRARVRLARIRRGIPLYTRPEGAPVESAPDRLARWYRYRITAERCRCCAQDRHTRMALRNREAMVRWTDQGPMCAEHYGALSGCPRCGAPVMARGDLCEGCVTRWERRRGEACGWRQPVAILFPTLERGEVSNMRPRRHP